MPREHFHALHFARFAGICKHAHDARGLEGGRKGVRHLSARESGRGRPERHLHVARTEAVAHPDPVDAKNFVALKEAQRAAQGLRGLLNGLVGQQAGVRGDELMAGLGPEAEREAALGISFGTKLQLVAIAQLAFRGHARSNHGFCRFDIPACKVRERRDNVISLCLQLGFVGDVHPLAAAAHARVRAGGHHTVRRGLHDIEQARMREGLLVFRDLYAHHVARRSMGYENGLAVVQTADAGLSVRQRVDAHRLFHGSSNQAGRTPGLDSSLQRAGIGA